MALVKLRLLGQRLPGQRLPGQTETISFLRQGATQAARALSQINQRLYSSTFCVNHHFARWFHKHTLRHVFKTFNLLKTQGPHDSL